MTDIGPCESPISHWIDEFCFPEVMAGTAQPLVSCLMPTMARRRLFVPQAIRYFQRQNYPNKELLIVDYGRNRLRKLCGRF